MTTEKTFDGKPYADCKLIRALLALVVGGMCGIASAATYYVSSTYEGDDSDGTQERPFKTIQAALSAPNSSGGSVLIENGTYEISSELTILGGVNEISIRSVSGNPADVTIDAQGNCRCLNCTGTGYYIRGITFANGAIDGNGGGVLANTNCSFDDCVFRNCSATGNGGAIYSATSITIRHIDNVKIEGCTATSSSSIGGGVYLSEAPSEGVFNSSIENCTAGYYGGGMYLNSSASAVSTITNCNVSLNTCDRTGGGGIYAR